ncbi:hypothetical protein [Noviherbaspirillum denitrificans]|uniref:DUF4124 domain-containing protein n=1 Tax=Noviherbaspirillum denitrificans TaxID=1968433 RepID=A0A254T8P7_9BURK|nr:hypothetical protein [Noviherbaspirillum denitrificans]OWW19030.1 hypothetical protein AYR66_05520 [Noviherbaspirillum denitrificans]
MQLKYQKGLSLLWTSVIVGLVALAGMVTLMSARYERNYFAEGWKRLTKTDVGQAVQQAGQDVAKADAPPIRKCVIDGKTVYSNVECDKANPSSRKVEIHDTKGFEAPKVPVAAAPEGEGAPSMRDKQIDKAVNR